MVLGRYNPPLKKRVGEILLFTIIKLHMKVEGRLPTLLSVPEASSGVAACIVKSIIYMPLSIYDHLVVLYCLMNYAFKEFTVFF